MKIPPTAERDSFYNEIANNCLASVSDRQAMYDRWRSYYLFGCDLGESPAVYNKILPQMDLLTSFIFAAETTKFGLILGESVGAQRDIPKVPAMSAHVNSRWHDSHADVQSGQAIQWSLVYGSMFMKLVQRKKETVPYLVEPGCLGVLNEAMPFLDDQEAFVHKYWISHKALDRMLASHPRGKLITQSVTASMKQEERDIPAGIGRIIMSTFPMSGAPNGPGNSNVPLITQDAYRARVNDERVEMRELWIWDDDANDYRVVTLASGMVYIYDRENFYLSGEHPFVQFCPNPCYDYFWGHSEVDRLCNLQDARETRFSQMMELLNRQIKPPRTMKGQWQGIPDEQDYASQVFGGGMVSIDPTAEFEEHPPTLPGDTWAEIREIDADFNDETGLSNVTQGKGDAGVRSKGHAAELARLGSARVRKRAFTIEDSLDKQGELYFRLAKQHDDTFLMGKDGKPFIAEQFTSDCRVKVDAHSSSPIFVEDSRDLAFELFDRHAIDRAELIEATDPPNKQVYLAGLKRIEEAEQKAHAAEQAAKGGGAPKLSAAK